MNPAFAIEQRFLAALCDECRVVNGNRLLVAVSGGPDSIALLCLLRRASVKLGLELVMAHLDHGMRPESGRDGEFVRSLSVKFGLPLVSGQVSVPELATASKCGWEETARNARRAFLRRIAADCHCDLIALGHQRGDQAETVLHRLIRGAGATGLAAMRPRQEQIIRPLLGFTRDELVNYLQHLGQDFVLDTSNRDLRYTRNRIRHELMPLLHGFNPQIERRLAELSRRLTTEEDYWQEQVAQAWTILAPQQIGGQLVLMRSGLLALHPALRARVLRRGLVEAGVCGEIGSDHVTAIEHLLESVRPQGEVHLPAGWVGRRYDQLWLAANPPFAVMSWSREIAAPGDYPLPDGRVLRVAIAAQLQGEHPHRVEFAAGEVTFPLMLRSPRPGDRFHPSGMSGSKKLKDYFIDERLTKEERRSQLLVEAGELLWVVGRRRCAGFSPANGREVLGLELF